MTADDQAREDRIRRLQRAFGRAKTSDDARVAWDALRREIKARSPEQVARMETEKGLK